MLAEINLTISAHKYALTVISSTICLRILLIPVNLLPNWLYQALNWEYLHLNVTKICARVTFKDAQGNIYPLKSKEMLNILRNILLNLTEMGTQNKEYEA